jgi:hypothetical protein
VAKPGGTQFRVPPGFGFSCNSLLSRLQKYFQLFFQCPLSRKKAGGESLLDSQQPAMKKLKALRTLCEQQIASLNSILPNLDAELAKTFTAVKAEFEKTLKSLPALDQSSDDNGFNSEEAYLACLTNSQNIINGLVTSLSDLRTQHAAKLQTLTALEAKLNAGELVPKAQVTEMCSAAADAARKTAATETETRLKSEYADKEAKAKLINDRRTILVTNSLPAAPDEILCLSEEKFNAAKAEAEKRCAPFKGKLKPDGATLPKLAWCSAEEALHLSELLKEVTTAPKISYDPLMGSQTGNNKEIKVEFVPV